MNSTIQVIMARRSQRVFSEKLISEEEKSCILKCAMRAPTAGNMMLYSIIDVADPDKKKILSKTCDNQPFIARAPMVLLFLADMQRWYNYFSHSNVSQFLKEKGMTFEKPAESDLLLACCDALIAAQTAAIAAESMGIGSCYIGDIMEHYETHRDLFNLPPLTFPITLLVFGHYRDDQKEKTVTSRFEKEYICFTDKYKQLSGKEMDCMFQKRSEEVLKNKQTGYIKGARNLGQHIYLKKNGADFTREMRRSVRAALKSWKDLDNP